MGYMIGTFEIPSVSITYKGKGTLVAEYVEDKKLNYIFKRICEAFKNGENPIDEEVEE